MSISALSSGYGLDIVIPVRNSPDDEYHDALIEGLLRNGTVCIRYLGGVFAQSGIFHERVLDVAVADEGSVEDLTEEECESG